MDIPPLMLTTPGITEQEFTAEPLGTEGELTPGPDDANPYRNADERAVVEAYERKDRKQKEDGLYRTTGVSLPFEHTTKSDPTADPDPFVFDDVDAETDRLRLPFMESDGPQF